jgi:hypothetical protein
MIELRLTITQARKVRAALDGPSVTDPAVAVIFERLDHELKEIDEARAPWRKVVNYVPPITGSGRPGYEVLECGHHRSLKYGRGNAGWVEPRAQIRRCEKCYNDPK